MVRFTIQVILCAFQGGYVRSSEIMHTNRPRGGAVSFRCHSLF